MSLKIYKEKTPDFLRVGAGYSLFGVQLQDNLLLPIYGAYSSVNAGIKLFNAVRVDATFRVLETVELNTGLIEYKDGQYLTKAESISLDAGLYYLYFEDNLGQLFRSELFSVPYKEMRGGLNFSSDFYTFDSILQTFDNDIDYKLKIR